MGREMNKKEHEHDTPPTPRTNAVLRLLGLPQLHRRAFEMPNWAARLRILVTLTIETNGKTFLFSQSDDPPPIWREYALA